MTVTIRPDLERELQERLKSDAYGSPDELVNAALEQFIANEFAPGDLEQLLEVGVRQAAAGQLVEEEEVVRQLDELKRAARSRQAGASVAS